MAGLRGLRAHRMPGTVAEVRTLVAYNRRILDTSRSPQRRRRAEVMLVNLQPHIDRLEREARQAAPAHTGEPLLARIERSAPPLQSLDGRLQAWRDARGEDEREESERIRRIELAPAPPATTTVQPGEALLDARRRLEQEQLAAEQRRLKAWRALGEPELETVWSGGEGLTSYMTKRELAQ